MHIPKIVFLISFIVFTLRHILVPRANLKSLTMGLSKLGVQMAEAMFYGFKVVKKMVEV